MNIKTNLFNKNLFKFYNWFILFWILILFMNIFNLKIFFFLLWMFNKFMKMIFYNEFFMKVYQLYKIVVYTLLMMGDLCMYSMKFYCFGIYYMVLWMNHLIHLNSEYIMISDQLFKLFMDFNLKINFLIFYLKSIFIYFIIVFNWILISLQMLLWMIQLSIIMVMKWITFIYTYIYYYIILAYFFDTSYNWVLYHNFYWLWISLEYYQLLSSYNLLFFLMETVLNLKMFSINTFDFMIFMVKVMITSIQLVGLGMNTVMNSLIYLFLYFFKSMYMFNMVNHMIIQNLEMTYLIFLKSMNMYMDLVNLKFILNYLLSTNNMFYGEMQMMPYVYWVQMVLMLLHWSLFNFFKNYFCLLSKKSIFLNLCLWTLCTWILCTLVQCSHFFEFFFCMETYNLLMIMLSLFSMTLHIKCKYTQKEMYFNVIRFFLLNIFLSAILIIGWSFLSLHSENPSFLLQNVNTLMFEMIYYDSNYKLYYLNEFIALLGIVMFLFFFFFKLTMFPFYLMYFDFFKNLPSYLFFYLLIVPKMCFLYILGFFSSTFDPNFMTSMNYLFIYLLIMSMFCSTMGMLSSVYVKSFFFFSSISNMSLILLIYFTDFYWDVYTMKMIIINLYNYMISTLTLIYILYTFNTNYNSKFYLENLTWNYCFSSFWSIYYYLTFETKILVLSSLFFSIFSLAGLSPTLGFFSKVYLLEILFTNFFVNSLFFFFLILFNSFGYIRLGFELKSIYSNKSQLDHIESFVTKDSMSPIYFNKHPMMILLILQMLGFIFVYFMF